jgi:uncharacterized protein YjbI with pentapeptide repeats
MNQKQLDELVMLHGLWLNGDEKGVKLVVRDEDFIGLEIKGDLSRALFDRCNFVECVFEDLVAADSRFSLCNFSECRMDKVNLKSSSFIFNKFYGSQILESDLNDVNFRGSDLIDINFTGTNLESAEFFNATVKSPTFARVNAKDVGHLPLMAWSGLSGDHNFVYYHTDDRVWFNTFEGTLDEFIAYSVNPEANLSESEIAVFRHMTMLLREYKTSVEVSLAG